MKITCFITILLLSGNLFLVSAQQNETAARDVYDWKTYDNKSSVVKKDAIDFRMLQGRWTAYESWHYGDIKKFWKDANQPSILEIRGNQYRSGSYGTFKTYKLTGHLLVFDPGSKADSAYINMINDSKLTISFKRGKDFEKYLFQR